MSPNQHLPKRERVGSPVGVDRLGSEHGLKTWGREQPGWPDTRTHVSVTKASGFGKKRETTHRVARSAQRSSGKG